MPDCSSNSIHKARQVARATASVASPPMDWFTYRHELRPRRRTVERVALASRYGGSVVDRLELGRAVGTHQRSEPLYSVVPYKEAFSPGLVRHILDLAGVQSGRLLDPFAGAGTSLLVAAERGLGAVGVDILPFAAFAANTLLHASLVHWNTVDTQLRTILSHPQSRLGRFPNFPVREWAFGPAALSELTDLDTAIAGLPAGRERDALRLALLSSIELMSQATKDGTSLRRRPHGSGRNGRFGTRRTRADVQAAFQCKVDLLRTGAASQPAPTAGSAALAGDARDLRAVLGEQRFDVAVFSPPYPNRYDYVGNYQLELGFGFIDDADSLRRLRKQQLRSHLESPWPPDRTVEHPALNEFLAAYLASDLRSSEAGRVFRMVCGYFEDMSAVLAGLRSVLHPGATAAIVVGTQVFGGEHLPTDLLLADIADAHGFAVKEIWVARTKGMAVQQRRVAPQPVPSREVVLILAA